MDNGYITNEFIRLTPRGPYVAGTRITIYQLMEHLKDGWIPRHVANWFRLTPEQMDGVMAFINANEAVLEEKYAEVLRRAEEERIYWTERNKDRDKLPGNPPANHNIAIARARLAAIKAERERCKSS
ncbi:MAG: DUF433 domain-containing protein [Blastocatellia bacterium]